MERPSPSSAKRKKNPSPVIHDVNNSLPPVVERGVDHEGMSHAGCGGGGGKDKEEILSLFVWKSRVKSSCAESRSESRVESSCAESRSESPWEE